MQDVREIRLLPPRRLDEDNSVDAELIQFELQEAGLSFVARVVMTEEDFLREWVDMVRKVRMCTMSGTTRRL
jgi:hypothetical protein